MNNNELSAKEALQLITPFFKSGWNEVSEEEIVITPILGGLSNRIWFVKMNKVRSDGEPMTVIIRKAGGNLLDLTRTGFHTPTSLAVVSYELSKLNLGPKLYGLFPGGQIEEFIKCHTLTPWEAAEPAIAKDIAVQMASIHSIKGLPIACNASIWENLAEQWRQFEKKQDEVKDHPVFRRYQMQDFDFLQELEWLENLTNSCTMRKNFILMDTNYMNCLVREDRKSEVVLIDYEMSHINYRGIDIGSHFFNRRIKYNGIESKILEEVIDPPESERRSFIQHYSKQLKKLKINGYDGHGVDSVDHILFEAKIGEMIFMLFVIAYVFNQFEVLEQDKAFEGFTFYSLLRYKNLKAERPQEPHKAKNSTCGIN